MSENTDFPFPHFSEGEIPDSEEIQESMHTLLMRIGEEADTANEFSEWAADRGLSPIGILAVMMSAYTHLRTFLPDISLLVILGTMMDFVEHSHANHPGVFYTEVKGEAVPLPFVNPGDPFGAGQSMLKSLQELKEGQANG